MSRLWDRILEPAGLTTVFQPIFEVRGVLRSVFALEALTRGPKATNIERSDVLFEYVRRKRRENVIDRMAIAAALRHARGLPELPGLCFNVHASTLEEDYELPDWLAETADEYGIPLGRVILEIVEHAPPWSGRQFGKNLDRLREHGVRIALDDVGLGQSNFRMIVDCRPDLLKIDRVFVTGVYRDDYRRAVLESIAHLADRIGSRAVAEGIEDEMDLDAVLNAGIGLLQGFHLCPPHPSQRLRNLHLPFPVDDGWPASPVEEDRTPTDEIR